MKKALCFTICILCVFLFAGCGSNETTSRPTLETEASGVDIVKYVKLGTIPEIKYTLGDDGNAIITAFEESEDEYFSIMDGEEYTTVITPDNANLIFETGDKKKEIKYIVSFGKSYGFETETDSNTVTSVMEEKGYSASLEEIPEDLAKFVPGGPGCDCLSYTIEDTALHFVFDNNYLAATIIYKKG